MATTTTYTTNASYSIREDLSDIVKNISPVDTPFLSSIKKGKATSTTHVWNEDSLAAAANTPAIEGADSTAVELTMPVRRTNYTQITTKDWQISGTMEAVNSAGNATKPSYQLAKKLKEHARDKEYVLLNAAINAGNTTVGRQLMGAIDWLNDSAAAWYDSACYYNFGSATEAATNDLTDTILLSMVQAVWENGAEPDTAWVSPTQKRIISTFNQNNRITVNAEADMKKIIGVVDFYESDFGVIKIVPERFFADDYDTGTTAYYDKVLISQKDMWSIDYLRPTKNKELAVTGDSTKYQIVSEYTLANMATGAHALIENISRV